MQTIFRRIVYVLFIIQIVGLFANAQEKRGPVTGRELFGLLAGNALAEDVIHEIDSRGVAFRLTEQCRSLVTEAGGDSRVLKALENANAVKIEEISGCDGSDKLLQHLSSAGKLERSNKYEEVAKELTAALQSGGGSETGFVMGGLLYKQGAWPQAAGIYSEVLRQDSQFTEAHIKFSYVLFKLGDLDAASSEARKALAQNPNSAEAHRMAGVVFDERQQYMAAEQEYKEALRLKPDYAVAHYDMAILFHAQKKWDLSIAEYKKSIVLDPSDERAHYNLANLYFDRGDSVSSIHEYREAIRLNPDMLWARQNLGDALIHANMNAEAVVELRKLEALAPNSATCHESLGTALFRMWKVEDAKEEYRKAISLDPSQADAHVGLGSTFEEEKNYAEALDEYRKAERLDETYADAYMRAGRVLLAEKDFAGALKELKSAGDIAPASAATHDLFGQALDASGDQSAAVAEFKQAINLDPKNPQFKVDLARAYEKNKDWAQSIDLYHQAALSDPSADMQTQYKLAQGRINQQIASMKASGKTAEAKTVEKQIRTSNVEPGISEQLNAAMEAGWNALGKNHSDEAEVQYKKAIDLALKLQPHDERLATSYIRLSSVYFMRKDADRGDEMLHRALDASVEAFGPDSPFTTEPLQSLGLSALSRKNYKLALDYFSRAVDLNKKTFGEASDKVADCLRFVAQAYVAQGQYDKAEPYLLRAVRINESLFGATLPGSSGVPLWELCNLYDKWGKPEKAEPRYHEMLLSFEKQYGVDSPVLLSTLTGEANALHKLGRNDEASAIERRMQSIRGTTSQATEAEPMPHP